LRERAWNGRAVHLIKGESMETTNPMVVFVDGGGLTTGDPHAARS
jgi:hypothetical protein